MSEPNTAPEGHQNDQTAPEGTGQQNAPENGAQPPEGTEQTEPETFPRQYVEDLRRENAEARTKAKRTDTLTSALVVELARATGRMADPTDLPPSDALLDGDGMPDPSKVDAAITALLGAKPHLASRKPRGDVGQGATADPGGVDLAGLLRAGAG